MDDFGLYNIDREKDHLDHLYMIVDLAKIGAASTDTGRAIPNLLDAQASLFEAIYELAGRAVESAELERKTQKTE